MMHPFFADITGLEISGIICGMIFSGGAFIVALIALFRKSDTEISPQPLAVQIVEELHERFAGKREFKEHVEHNTARHAQIFKEIQRVEREVGIELNKITQQVASLSTETKLQSKQLDKLDETLEQMPGRIVVDIINSKKL